MIPEASSLPKNSCKLEDERYTIERVVKNKEASVGEEQAKKRFPIKKITFLVLGSIGIVLLLGTSVYFYTQYQKSQSLLKNPSITGQQEVESLIQKVSKHYDLPMSDQVTVATVSDSNKLKGQIFFAKAQNGDKVLIYPKTGLAIIYRPSLDKIINVGPVDTQGDSAQQVSPATSSIAAVIKVALYNGTQTTGLTKKVEDSLATLSSVKTSVIVKANATANYTDSVVIDLTGKNAQAATQLAAFAKGKVTSLPTGETKPEGVDILIILGQSYVGTPTPIPQK